MDKKNLTNQSEIGLYERFDIPIVLYGAYLTHDCHKQEAAHHRWQKEII